MNLDILNYILIGFLVAYALIGIEHIIYHRKDH